jgi:uncharacterized phage protein (TIGR01671 family)
MRIIKFRAFCNVQNKMFYPKSLQHFSIYEDGSWDLHESVTISDNECEVITGDTSDGEMAEFYDGVLMQYTGLKDKNGKEIYESDLLSLDDIVVEITFNNGGFQMIMNKNQGSSVAVQERVKNFEVIGNIYQNPELI